MASVVAAWPTVALGEVLRQRKQFVQIDDTLEYKRCRVQLHAQGIVLRDRVTGIEVKTKSQQVCREGEFLVAEIDAKVGGFGIVPDELDGAIVSSHYFLFEVNEARLDKRFLDYYIRTADFQDQVTAQGSTNYAAIRPSDVLGYTIPLPPLDEQRRIVVRIEALAGRIAEARGLRQAAMAEAEALWEVGASSLLDALRGTTSVPLGEVVSVQGGGTPSKSNPLLWVGNIPWISPKDMKSRRIRDSHDHISEVAVAQSTARLLEPGAVLVVTRGMILAHTVPVAVLETPATINQDLKALIPHHGLMPAFLCGVLWALNHKLLQRVERSSHDTRKLETAKLLDFEIPIPDLATQSELIARFDDLQMEVEALQCSQSEAGADLDALLPSLLDRAFQGEL